MSEKGNTDASSQEDLHIISEDGEQSVMWRSNQLTYIAQGRQELPSILATKFGKLAIRLDLSYNSLTSFRHINSFTNLSELILDNNELEDDQLNLRLNLRLKTLSLNKNKLADLYKLINAIKVCYPNLEYLSLIGNPLCPGPICSSNDYKSVSTRDSLERIQGSGELGEGPSNDDIGVTMTTKLATNGGMRGIDELILSENLSTNDGNSSREAKLHTNQTASTDDFGQQKYRHFIIYHLPNLKFLDSSPISNQERDDALRRCFWMNRTKMIARDDSTPAGNDVAPRDEAVGLANLAGDQGFQMNILADLREDPQQRQPKGVFSRLAHKYTGKNSEGNRFIRNHDL